MVLTKKEKKQDRTLPKNIKMQFQRARLKIMKVNQVWWNISSECIFLLNFFQAILFFLPTFLVTVSVLWQNEENIHKKTSSKTQAYGQIYKLNRYSQQTSYPNKCTIWEHFTQITDGQQIMPSLYFSMQLTTLWIDTAIGTIVFILMDLSFLGCST